MRMSSPICAGGRPEDDRNRFLFQIAAEMRCGTVICCPGIVLGHSENQRHRIQTVGPISGRDEDAGQFANTKLTTPGSFGAIRPSDRQGNRSRKSG